MKLVADAEVGLYEQIMGLFWKISKYFVVNDNDHCIKPKSVLHFPCLCNALRRKCKMSLCLR